ncbi:MAG: hypothetical protein HY098_09280 [Nitrospinae bacterium]|nr:hypothetical protein [Nitrospinota bacterium]
MDIVNIEVLDPNEAAMAKVLIRNNLAPVQAFNDYISFKKRLLKYGKPFLGDILFAMDYITKDDLDLFEDESEKEHSGFIESLCQKGFLTQEQRDDLLKQQKETGTHMAALIIERQIMTKEIYNKLFQNSAIALKLGEWLVARGKISAEKLDEALEFQKVANLENYLVHHLKFNKEVLGKIKAKMGVE